MRTIKEDLRNWFSKTHSKGDWVRLDPKTGKIKGPCAREEGEGKPKCLNRSRAESMSKKERAEAARRKRRKDPVADRKGKGGKPVNVKTESYTDVKNISKEELIKLRQLLGTNRIPQTSAPKIPKPANEEYIIEKNSPTNPALWSRAKALAKSKFDVYPSAYANGWAAKWYKSKGGGWKSTKKEERKMKSAMDIFLEKYTIQEEEVIDIVHDKDYDHYTIMNQLKTESSVIKKLMKRLETSEGNLHEWVCDKIINACNNIDAIVDLVESNDNPELKEAIELSQLIKEMFDDGKIRPGHRKAVVDSIVGKETGTDGVSWDFAKSVAHHVDRFLTLGDDPENHRVPKFHQEKIITAYHAARTRKNKENEEEIAHSNRVDSEKERRIRNLNPYNEEDIVEMDLPKSIRNVAAAGMMAAAAASPVNAAETLTPKERDARPVHHAIFKNIINSNRTSEELSKTLFKRGTVRTKHNGEPVIAKQDSEDGNEIHLHDLAGKHIKTITRSSE